MINQIYVGNEPALSLPVPAGTKAGDPVKVGSFVGVAATDRADSTVNPITAASANANSSGNPDGYASVEVSGTYLIAVTGAITAPGTPIYLVAGTPATLSTTASGNTLFGYSVAGPNNKYATTSSGAVAAVRIGKV